MWLLIGLVWAGVPEDRVAELVAHRGDRGLKSVPAVPADAYAKALAGEVVTGLQEVPGHKAQIAWGVAVVDQGIDRYWAAVNDDRNKVAYTKLSHLELLEGEYCGAKRTVFQYLDISMLSDRWWVVVQLQNSKLSTATSGHVREMTWQNVDPEGKLNATAKTWAEKGMQLPFTEGSWTVLDLGDGRTLVEYYAWSDPGGNIPAKMASSFAAGGISDTIESMRKLAAKGPTCL